MALNDLECPIQLEVYAIRTARLTFTVRCVLELAMRDTGLLAVPTFTDLLRGNEGETGEMDCGKTCYGRAANLLRTYGGEVTNVLTTCYAETDGFCP